MNNPANWGLFAWQAGWVFTLRSLDLMARPDSSGAELARMAIEKQKAFADGWIAAGHAAMRGESPAAVMEAAAKPARRRVSANLRTLRRKG
ncbi:hypothetical protein J8J14_01940 [Roseomonas sp. SSH11]|uniref:Antifreeze protein n=1 Tax=Pararoseomonas baculiformis TaxID=2820812 RepID=A0ABS4AAJ5_9PROT|nr:hypothetical protein [Pararoseomonas baculiformis]MBP0443528.1 hypothetical protein [Pararoseomonas baculiformis]